MADTIQKVVNNYSVTGTTVVANPSPAGTTSLTGLQVGSTKYKVNSGTTVVANPSDPGTTPLSSIQIDSSKYVIEAGSGGGAVGDSAIIPLGSLKSYIVDLYHSLISDMGNPYSSRMYYLNGIQSGFFHTYTALAAPLCGRGTLFDLKLAEIVNIVGTSNVLYFGAFRVQDDNSSDTRSLFFQITQGGGGGGSGSGSGSGNGGNENDDPDTYTFSLCMSNSTSYTTIADSFYSETLTSMESNDTTVDALLTALREVDLASYNSVSEGIISNLYDFLDDKSNILAQCYLMFGFFYDSISNPTYFDNWSPVINSSDPTSLTSNLNFCTFNQFFKDFLGIQNYLLDFFIYGTNKQSVSD